mmetsp:Transcript_27275/g.43888  ORF Transcript_27275/g.43888 Transcript_27275/m.43888 type:complete len:101 (-) Transcript_27275:350-652(-)
MINIRDVSTAETSAAGHELFLLLVRESKEYPHSRVFSPSYLKQSSSSSSSSSLSSLSIIPLLPSLLHHCTAADILLCCYHWVWPYSLLQTYTPQEANSKA